MIISGRLTRSIDLYSETQSQSTANGSVSTTLAKVRTIRAAIDSKSSAKIYEDDQQKQQDDAVFIVRYQAASDVTINWQLEYEGKRYGIREASEAVEFGYHVAIRLRCYAKT